MADDRLLCCRSLSIAMTRRDKVWSRSAAISRSPFQNASSRLTLVLWPAMTIERLTIEDFTGDFMACPPRFRVDRRAPADITARMELGSREFQYGFVPNRDVIATPLEFRHGI